MIDALWQRLFGSLCVLCRETVTGREAYRQLCPWCLDSLPWRPTPDLELAGLTRAFAPLAYEGAARAWVLAAKNDRGLVAARTLGVLLAASLADAYPFPSGRPERLIPVPLSARRLRSRGHNQASLVAAPVSRQLQIPIHQHDARRLRHTPILAGMDAEARSATVARIFSAGLSVNGARVAIIDDVVTSGATARALAGALTEAGASEVHLWAATAATHTD